MLSNWVQNIMDDMLSRTEPYAVKLYGRDSAGQPAGEWTGVQCHTQQSLIYTVVHELGTSSSGAVSFEARYPDGFQELVSAEPRPQLHAGCSLGKGVLVLRGNHPCSKPLLAQSMPSKRDTVYVLGYRPGSTDISTDQGVVSGSDMEAFYITAPAAGGWPGGLVISQWGKLIGLVHGGAAGSHNDTTVRVVPSEAIDFISVESNLPGLPTS